MYPSLSKGGAPLREARDPFWHVFTFLGTRYLYDVESGALHRVDDVLSEIVDLFGVYPLASIVGSMRGRYDAELVVSAHRDLETMLEQGLLTPIPRDAGVADSESLVGAPDTESTTPRARSNDRPLKAVCLHAAHACNLACSYCFVADAWRRRQGGSQPPFGDAALMPPEVGKAAVDLMIRESGAVKQLEVDFFGGEPLLNFDSVVQIADYALEAAARANKSVHFSLTTNAVGITPEIVEYMDRMHFSVILSIDGRPETHDRWRRFPDGTSSHARVAAGISEYLERTGVRDYYVRGTYTRANLDFAKDVAYLLGLGIDRISMEPVVGSPESEYGIGTHDLPAVRREYELLVTEYRSARRAGRPFEFFHFNLGALTGQCHERRLMGCGAGNQYLAVTPSGDLYPCHQFVGDTGLRLGDVWSGVTRLDVADRFRGVGVLEKPRCRRCWARYLCSGGCHAAAYKASGRIDGVDEVACGITKMRLEAALAAYAETSRME
ncbi:MAG: thioether cross-link-forming SCIFF peptide maturase [Firmicutes bacterium]|nr:thioether cross-link-forming SCIFF peptide maturase [Bacillota bacterium]